MFIRNLKNRIQKHMIAISKNLYISKLDEVVDKYRNAYHRTIELKPVDIELGTYIDFDIESNAKVPEFKVGNHVRISKYKSVFAKRYTPS